MTHRRTSYICFALSSLLAFVTLLLVFADTAHAQPKEFYARVRELQQANGLPANAMRMWSPCLQGLPCGAPFALANELAPSLTQNPSEVTFRAPAGRVVHASARPRLATSDCTVTNKFIYPAGKKAKFIVSGECVVSLVAYEMRNGGALADQVLYDSTTEEFSCTSVATAAASSPRWSNSSALASTATPCRADLTVTVPDCRYQTDLVFGQPRPNPLSYQPGEVLAWRFGGNGECQTSNTTTSPPPTTTTTPTRPTTSLTTSTSVSTTTTLAQGTTSAPTATSGRTPSTPTEELAQSGFEWGWLGLVGLGLIGAGRYVEVRGKRRRTG